MPSLRVITRFRLALVAAVAASLAGASPAVAARPVACFTQSPATVQTRTVATFDSTCSSDTDNDIVSRGWDLDNDGAYDDGSGVTATKSWSTSGTYTVRLRLADRRGGTDIEAKTVTVQNRPPVAAFTFSPAAPLSGQTITFTSTSRDSDGSIVKVEWDTDGNATTTWGAVQGNTTTKVFPLPGTYTIRIRATDNNGRTSTASAPVTVGNRAPVADFAITPADPFAGDAVTLSSSAADQDGTIASQSWDLDNDGEYDDAAGSSATWIPDAPGTFSVGLRVTDNSNAAHAVTKTIAVGERSGPPPPSGVDQPLPEQRTDITQAFDVSSPIEAPTEPLVVAPLRLLDPFPVVRMRGRTTRRGARLSLLSVRAPHGSVVVVRCIGRGCPSKRQAQRVRTRSNRGSRSLRFKRYERFLRAGVKLHVAVTKDGMVGKYTRIRIRRLSLPVRVDRCLVPGSFRPTKCPSAP